MNYRSKEFTTAVHEYFDIHDIETRKILLAVNEVDQNQILASLTSKLYNNIVDKVDDIDFGDIPRTKGDITQLPNYDKIVDCINTLKNILIQYKQPEDPVLTIEHALENIKIRRELFTKAYRYNIEVPMVLYNTICLAIISSISLMISTSIEFIKTPNSEDFKIILDKVSLNKTKNSLLFLNLKKFNEACRKGDIDNSLETLVRNKLRNLTGVEVGIAAGTIAAIGILFNIVPILRELIFFFYYSRTRVSEYFDIQADLLQMNANNLDASRITTGEDKRKVADRQSKIAQMFRKIANKLAVTAKTSEAEATKEISSANKNKINDVVDSVPDSATSALF